MRYALVILFSLLFFSCKKVEKLEKLPINNKINLICLVTRGEYFTFQIYKSLSAIDNARQDKALTNATVYLYENGVCTDTVKYNSMNKLYFSKIRANDGVFYEIKVTSPGLATATASMRLAPAITNISGTMQFTGSSDDTKNGNHYQYYHNLRIHTDLSFPRAIGGVRLLLFEQWSWDRSREIYYSKWKPLTPSLETTDLEEFNKFQPDITPGSMGTWFSVNPNDYFDNWDNKTSQGYDFICDGGKSLVLNNRDSMEYLVCRVTAYDKPAYQHVRSMALYAAADDTPFNEPVQISSNIQNGYGLFGSYSEAKIKIPIKKK